MALVYDDMTGLFRDVSAIVLELILIIPEVVYARLALAQHGAMIVVLPSDELLYPEFWELV